MADNKQNQDQKKNERTNDAVGMPADQSNQRGNQNMETQGGNRAEQKTNMSGGSDRVDNAGDATRGEGSAKQMQNQSGNQGNMQEKRPSGSNEADEREEGDTREKRPA